MTPQQQLAEQYMPFARKLVRAYASLIAAGRERIEEMEGDAFLGLVQAANDYDPGRGIPFTSFSGLRIRGAIVDGIRRQNRHQISGIETLALSEDDLVDEADSPLAAAAKREAVEFIRANIARQARGRPSNEAMRNKSIGKDLGISSPAVSWRLNRARKILDDLDAENVQGQIDAADLN